MDVVQEYRLASAKSDAHDDECPVCSAFLTDGVSDKRCETGQALTEECIAILARRNEVAQ